MKVPTDVQISIALSYLRNNREEEGGEREACAAVAAWIEHEMLDRFVKAQARASGISVKRLRDAIKEGGHGPREAGDGDLCLGSELGTATAAAIGPK